MKKYAACPNPLEIIEVYLDDEYSLSLFHTFFDSWESAHEFLIANNRSRIDATTTEHDSAIIEYIKIQELEKP